MKSQLIEWLNSQTTVMPVVEHYSIIFGVILKNIKKKCITFSIAQIIAPACVQSMAPAGSLALPGGDDDKQLNQWLFSYSIDWLPQPC